MWIVNIDTKVPQTSLPIEWTIEIGSGTEGIPLPLIKDIAEIKVTAIPVGAKHVVLTGHRHQVVEIDFISCLVLCISEIELVGHLVGQEKCFSAGLFVWHSVCRYCYCQYGNQGKQHLFHNRIFLMV